MSRVRRDDDQQAFAALLDRHLPGLQVFLRRMAASALDVDDLCQEAFVRVWERRRSWRHGMARFTTWLYRIGYNLAVDALRRRREFAADPEQIVDWADRAQRQQRGDDGEDLVERDETVNAVRAALAALPLRQRTALALYHLQGISQRDGAQVMGISVAAMESLLRRARRSLRQVFARDDLKRAIWR